MDPGTVAIVASGIAGWLFLRALRPRRHRLAGARLSTEADVVLHVARHTAGSREQWLAPLHLLYGLLQDETFTQAIQDAGGDPGLVEEKVLTALDEHPRDDAPSEALVHRILGTAIAVAEQRARVATITDVWAYLARTEVAQLVAAAGVPPVRILYWMVHGAESDPAQRTRYVDVVLRNDDYTACEFVVEVLRDVFELSEPDATAKMRATDEQGSAVIGRLPAELARDRVVAARERARARLYPLRIDAEPR